MSKDVEGEVRSIKIERENPFSLYLEMPDVGYAEYVLRMLIDIGISSSNGMGLAPISWTEIKSWDEVTRGSLRPWEAETIMELSRHFVSKFNEYDKKNVYSDHVVIEDPVIDKAKVADKVGAFFKMLIARRNESE